MKLAEFLDILHDTAELQTFGVMSPENPNAEDLSDEENRELQDQFEDFLLKHQKIYHEVGGKFAGLDETSYLIENITFDDLRELNEDFNQYSFIHAIRDPKKINEPVVYKKGDTKYIFRYYDKSGGSYDLTSKTSYIIVDDTLADNYSYFKDQPSKRWSFRFFEPEFDPEKTNYEHPYEYEEINEGVKESTIKKIREVINPRYRRLNG